MNKAEIAYMRQDRPHVCALISLGNALLHLGIIPEPWDTSSAEFEQMVVESGAMNGPVIEEKLDQIEERFTAPSRWPRLRVDKYRALEMSKELAVKLLDGGAVVSMPIWDDKIGLHSILIVGHENSQLFRVVNRDPFTGRSLVYAYEWEALGFRRWNVPVRVYARKSQ